MIGSRDYKQNDLKRLFALSGCECANPSCSNKLIAKDYNSILGEICHIEAASSDGPRFNPKQTNEERPFLLISQSLFTNSNMVVSLI